MNGLDPDLAAARRKMHESLIILSAPEADRVRTLIDKAISNSDGRAIRTEGRHWSGQIGLEMFHLADMVDVV
ncbi:hypothetical protein [Streptomyces cucumeris]|uniref:hypothetical protein n=1 Tax=Streptomyces cucumeris TaxID=2962890 RepID=UPI0020C87E06|nr:hypothetical protein [Streptomyces sp. NEAU-Y11]MCP9209530.1 hypothetical protein [Streptomyces sp. NEAU-Y11]